MTSLNLFLVLTKLFYQKVYVEKLTSIQRFLSTNFIKQFQNKLTAWDERLLIGYFFYDSLKWLSICQPLNPNNGQYNHDFLLPPKIMKRKSFEQSQKWTLYKDKCITLALNWVFQTRFYFCEWGRNRSIFEGINFGVIFDWSHFRKWMISVNSRVFIFTISKFAKIYPGPCQNIFSKRFIPQICHPSQ